VSAKITYKSRGFKDLDVYYKTRLHAYISATYGKGAAFGNWHVQFKATGLDAYTQTLQQSKDLVETFIGDLENE
jgi:hypothetical protein